MARFEKMETAERDEKEDKLAKEVRAATFKQISAHLEHDLEVMGKRYAMSKDAEAVEASKDAKFLRDRQTKLVYVVPSSVP